MASTPGGDAATASTRAPSPDRPWLRTFLMITLTVVIPLCLYYFVYAAWSAAEMQRRNLRLLAAMARDVAEANTRRARVLQWSSIRKDDESGDKDHDGSDKADDPRQRWCKKVAERLKSGQLLKMETAQCNDPKPLEPGERPETWRLTLEPQSEWLYVLDLNRNGMHIRATAPLRDLVPLEDARADFDALVVRWVNASPKGSPSIREEVVVHNTDYVPELIDRVVTATPAANAKADDPATAAVSRRKWVPDFLDFPDLPRTRIANEEYVTFAVPVTLRLPPLDPKSASPDGKSAPPDFKSSQANAETAQPNATGAQADARGAEGELITLSIEGLVSPDRLRKQALALSPNTLTYLICAVIAAVFTLPYLKIRFMARRERLRRIDLGMLAATALGGTALATVLIVHGAARLSLREWMDRRMADIGADMQHAVTTEVELIKEQLKDGGRELAKDQHCVPGGKRSVSDEGSLLLHDGGRYPDFEAIFCTDRDGQQLSKWTARSPASPLVPILEDYFRRALLLTRLGGADDAADAVVFDRINAKSTGRPLAVFARPINGNSTKDDAVGFDVPLQDRTGLLVLSTQMHSLSNAVLPVPFQYVVLTRDETGEGKVLFPDSRRHRQFLVETRNDYSLLRLLTSAGPRGSTPVDRNYLGRVYRMQAFSLESLPGKLVVFYDTAYLDAVSVETMVSSAVCVLALVIGCLVAVLLATMLRGAALDAIWPTVQHWPIYLAGIALSVAFAAGVWLVAVHGGPLAKALVLIGAPPLAIFVFLVAAPSAIGWLSADGVALNQTMHRQLHPSLYLVFATLALIALAAVPTLLIVSDARQAYVGALRDMMVQGQQNEIRRRSGADLDRFDVVPQTVRKAPQGDIGERIYIHQADYTTLASAVVPLAHYGSLVDKFRDGARDGLGLRPDEHVPAACGLLGFGGAEATPQTYLAAWSAACLPALTAFHDALRDHVWNVDRRGPDRALAAPTEMILTGGAPLGLVLLVFVFAFARSIAHRILGLDFEDDGVHDRHAELANPNRKRWLLLRPPRAVLKEVCGMKWDGPPLDLTQPDCTVEKITQAKAQKSVLLLNLDAQLHHGDLRDAVRALIASSSVETLFIVSAIDPLHYLTGRQLEQLAAAATDKEAAACMQEIEAWAQALSSLDKARFAKPPAGERAKAPEGADPGILEKLRRECHSTDFLRDVERDLLARSDFTEFDWEGIVEYVQDVAEPQYRALWGLCSEEEKLTLIHLAQEGVINPRAFDVLRRLRRRRLVRCDPRFRIVNESFRRFVLEAESPEQVERWELPGNASTWAMLRTPLLLLLIVVTAIIVITQQGVFNDTLGVATVATGAVGAVATLVAQARKVFSPSA